MRKRHQSCSSISAHKIENCVCACVSFQKDGGGTSLCRHHTKFRRAPPKRWPVSYCLWFRYLVSTSGQRTLILTEISFYFRAKTDQSEDKRNPAREGRQCKQVYGRASYVQLCSISKSLRGTGGHISPKITSSLSHQANYQGSSEG